MPSDPPNNPSESRIDNPDIDFEQIRQALDRRVFVERFSHQTERGAALSAVAQLDDALYRALRKWLLDDEEVAEAMFQEMQPLGSLGARIRMGYLLGMYGRAIFDNMKIVGRIRNTFAHTFEAKDFDYPRVRSLTENLTVLRIAESLQDPNGNRLDLNTLLPGGDKNMPHWKFVLSVFLLASIVNVAGRSPPVIRRPPV